MIRSGILNPAMLSLLARTRHTNTIVIADRGFPFWPALETVDLALVDNMPTVDLVLDSILRHCVIGHVYAAEEFRQVNSPTTVRSLRARLKRIPLTFEPHDKFKERVPGAVGFIRTGDTIPYSNLILESA